MDDAHAHRAASDLLADLPMPWEADVPLGPRTWYGTGGAAEVLAHPQTIEQLQTLARRCADAHVPLHVLGSGANLLVTDSGVPGVVVELDAPVFGEINIDRDRVTVGAGHDLQKLILGLAREGLAGLEALAGIPASVGGAVRMNAGGRYGATGDYVAEVVCLNQAGRMRVYTRKDLTFGYRRTNITEPVILNATFELTREDPTTLRDRVKEIYAYKKSTQPLAENSAGCAFKNPPADVSAKGAGQLIDEAGLKGLRIGGAEVSHRHANFIVLHTGGAADDVLRLIRTVTRRVQEATGVLLEREVVVWGAEPVEEPTGR
jgi:UDP-N-acetylmuramate dehydrogenase